MSTPAALQHTTVLLVEAVDAVVHRPDGLYVDGTFGRGGHSRADFPATDPVGIRTFVTLDGREPGLRYAAE